MPGPTWSNRYFVHGASSNGLDHMPTNAEIAWWNSADGFGFPNGSIYDSLNQQDVDWCVYQDLNGPYAGGFAQVHSIQGVHWYDVNDLADFASDLQNNYSYGYTFIEPNYGNVIDENYEGGSSQHPMDSVHGGENLIAHVYEAIRNSPLWNSSLLIITYDEHGGFYDSVAPGPIVAPGDGGISSGMDDSLFAFNVAGVRVPAVVVSPWIPAGKVDHTVYDHSSVIATLNNLFGLSPLTDRDQNANNVLQLLSMSVPRIDCPVTLPRPAAPTAAARPVITPERRAALDLEPLPRSGNLQGFLGVALKTELELAARRPQLRAGIQQHFQTIRTRGQARAYMQLVKQKLAAARATRK
jgi:phospholipase C